MSFSKQSRSSVFVPSPQWLSQSPGRLASSTASGTSQLRHTPRGSPGRFEGLMSPIPPPPPNLFPEPEDSFTVDPGFPFLATMADYERAMEREDSEKDQRFVGGFVSSIRDGVRRSFRRSHYPREPGFLDHSDVMDSGYSSTPASEPPLRGRQPSITEAVTSHEGVYPIEPSTEHPIQYYPHPPSPIWVSDEGYPLGYDPILAVNRYPEGTESQQSTRDSTGDSTDMLPAPDYARMRHPPDMSHGSYLRRFKRLAHHLASLPFSNKYRVTYDYDPERDQRDRGRLPIIVWQRPDFREPTGSQDEVHVEPSTMPTTAPHENPVPATTFESDDIPVVIRPTSAHHTPRNQFADNTPTFIEPVPIEMPSGWQSSTADPTWFDAFNVPRPPSAKSSVKSAKRWRDSTPYHAPVPITPETPRPEWQTSHPHHRRGYVPAEFAETHYGTRYGTGIHPERAGLAPFDSGPSSSTSLRPAINPR